MSFIVHLQTFSPTRLGDRDTSFLVVLVYRLTEFVPLESITFEKIGAIYDG